MARHHRGRPRGGAGQDHALTVFRVVWIDPPIEVDPHGPGVAEAERRERQERDAGDEQDPLEGPVRERQDAEEQDGDERHRDRVADRHRADEVAVLPLVVQTADQAALGHVEDTGEERPAAAARTAEREDPAEHQPRSGFSAPNSARNVASATQTFSNSARCRLSFSEWAFDSGSSTPVTRSAAPGNAFAKSNRNGMLPPCPMSIAFVPHAAPSALFNAP